MIDISIYIIGGIISAFTHPKNRPEKAREFFRGEQSDVNILLEEINELKNIRSIHIYPAQILSGKQLTKKIESFKHD